MWPPRQREPAAAKRQRVRSCLGSRQFTRRHGSAQTGVCVRRPVEGHTLTVCAFCDMGLRVSLFALRAACLFCFVAEAGPATPVRAAASTYDLVLA